jgi:Spy/CpxP family protein refolding chaperone
MLAGEEDLRMSSLACRMGIVASVLFGAGLTLGCGGSSANTPPPTPAVSTTSAVDDEATDALMEYHRYHHHGGVTLFIAMSVDTLGLSSERRAAVEKIRADLHAAMEPARTAERNLMATLADGLTAAKLDSAKVEAGIAQVIAAAAASHDASADALNRLHAVLTPAERTALVDKVESHWAVWRQTNAEQTGRDHLTMLATELDLTPEQVEAVRTGLARRTKAAPQLEPQELATQLRAFGDEFRSEDFDARALSTAAAANAQLAGWGAGRLARVVEVAAPVLTSSQRAALAQKLRAHAAHDPSARGTP